jgi:hypothetical protein
MTSEHTISWTEFPTLATFRPDAPRVRVVVVEEGARTFASPAGAEEWDETIVVVQCASEPSSVFARRVMQRMADVTRSGRAIGSLTLVIGSRHDTQTVSARRLVAHALAMYEHAGSCEFALALPFATPTVREELLSFAGSLVAELGKNALIVRLLFGSGVYPVSRPSEPPPRAGRDAA